MIEREVRLACQSPACLAKLPALRASCPPRHPRGTRATVSKIAKPDYEATDPLFEASYPSRRASLPPPQGWLLTFEPTPMEAPSKYADLWRSRADF